MARTRNRRWFMSRLVTSIVSMPAFGAFGSPTLFGGSSGSSSGDVPLTSAELDALGGRNTNTPGTVMPPIGDPTRINFNVIDATHFDGRSCLYNIASPADVTSFSLSFWINVDGIGAAPAGSIICSPFGGLGSHNWLNIDYQGVASLYAAPDNASGGAMAGGVSFRTAAVGYSVAGGADFTPGGVALPSHTNSWANILLSVNLTSATTGVINLYVNDTAVGDPAGTLSGFAFNPVARTIPLTYTAPGGKISGVDSVWAIGGASYHANLHNVGGSDPNYDHEMLPSGNGFQGCLTEVWFAPGQYLDFSVLANRQKFHSTDLVSSAWAPVSLGRDGSTPTGTKPMVYCAGRPDQIVFNRATGKLMREFGSLDLCFDSPPS